MNNHIREERRLAAERRDSTPMIDQGHTINRAHRDCERECLDLKARITEAESLLAEAGSYLVDSNLIKLPEVNELVTKIDKFLPEQQS